ncbi:hypothetical protein NUM3379_24500 [Kineococcus sp. NUM-3379]
MDGRVVLPVVGAVVLLLGGCGDAVSPGGQAGAASPDTAVSRPAEDPGAGAPGPIAGTVRDAAGGPVAGANVTVRSLEGGAVPEIGVHTSADGAYEFPAALDPGRYEVAVDVPAGTATAVAEVGSGPGPARADLVLTAR